MWLLVALQLWRKQRFVACRESSAKQCHLERTCVDDDHVNAFWAQGRILFKSPTEDSIAQVSGDLGCLSSACVADFFFIRKVLILQTDQFCKR